MMEEVNRRSLTSRLTDHTGMDREGKCSDTNRGNSLAASLTSFLLLIIAAVLLER